MRRHAIGAGARAQVEQPDEAASLGQVHGKLRVEQLSDLHVLVNVLAHAAPARLALPRLHQYRRIAHQRMHRTAADCACALRALRLARIIKKYVQPLEAEMEVPAHP